MLVTNFNCELFSFENYAVFENTPNTSKKCAV